MNTWVTLTDTFSRLAGQGKNLNRRSRGARRRLALFLAVVGPGLITSNVDNDAGGIAVYTTAGAHFGYALLWSLIPMTIALYVSEEMCARMGVVTGKGLSDLIREEFGFRSTFFVMLAAFAVDLSNTVAEFAGVAASMQIFGISKYVAVPIAAIAVWILVVRGSYRQVEKIFLAACTLYLGVRHIRRARETELDRCGQGHRDSLGAHERVVPFDVGRPGGHHDRALAIFLFAGRIRGKARWPAPV